MGTRAVQVVLIRLWNSECGSAGELNPVPDEYPDWPPEGVEIVPRRPRGPEMLDNTEADPPALWDVRVSAGDGCD